MIVLLWPVLFCNLYKKIWIHTKLPNISDFVYLIVGLRLFLFLVEVYAAKVLVFVGCFFSLFYWRVLRLSFAAKITENNHVYLSFLARYNTTLKCKWNRGPKSKSGQSRGYEIWCKMHSTISRVTFSIEFKGHSFQSAYPVR